MILEMKWNHPDIVEIEDDADIDYLPVFSEKKKFSELDVSEKMLLRNYIHSEIKKSFAYSNKIPSENELIEIKRQMIALFEEGHNVLLKNDAKLRLFFHDNAENIISKLRKKREND